MTKPLIEISLTPEQLQQLTKEHKLTVFCDSHAVMVRVEGRIPVTIAQLADFILGKPATTGQDFEDAKLPMMGGCEVCHATVACYNSCPSKTGYLRCSDCIGDLGFPTVEEAKAFVFPEVSEHTQDSHCRVNPITDCCYICGVYHGAPCQECGGRAFHLPTCSTQKEASHADR